MNKLEKEREKRRAQRQIWREEEAKEIEAAKAELSDEYGLERNAKFETAWGIAWEYGHSSGISEVKIYFDDLVPLLQP